MILVVMKEGLKICDECESEYLGESSPMMNLCPNCSHFLYGYENCNHRFENDRCVYCHWNGNISEYVAKLKKSK